jgi:hypothetical protein
MKQVHPNYTFNADTKVITLTGLNIDQDQLLLVTNATRGIIYYNFASSSHRAVVTAGANTMVRLTDASTTGHADSDQLVIHYEDQQNTQANAFAGDVDSAGGFYPEKAVRLGFADDENFLAIGLGGGGRPLPVELFNAQQENLGSTWIGGSAHLNVNVGNRVTVDSASAVGLVQTAEQAPQAHNPSASFTGATFDAGGIPDYYIIDFTGSSFGSTPGYFAIQTSKQSNFSSISSAQPVNKFSPNNAAFLAQGGFLSKEFILPAINGPGPGTWVAENITSSNQLDVMAYRIVPANGCRYARVVFYASGGGGNIYYRLRAYSFSGTVNRGTLSQPSATLSITTAATSQQVFNPNASRKYLVVQNLSDTAMYLGIGFTPVSSTPQGLLLSANGGGIVFESNFIPTEAVNIVCATAGKRFQALQG